MDTQKKTVTGWMAQTEVGLIQTQAKACHGVPATAAAGTAMWDTCAPKAYKGIHIADASVSDFWPPEPQENKFLPSEGLTSPPVVVPGNKHP